MLAITFGEGEEPQVAEFAEPKGRNDFSVVAIRAAALTNLDVAIAEGRHYFSPPDGPAIVGKEAVVITDGGARLFLNALAIPSPYGSMAERAPADLRLGLPVPPGISDEMAAAIGNPGLAAWLPLTWRAKLQAGESVLVLGATGVTGAMAVAAARRLGAGRVVAAGRNLQILDTLKSGGADAVIPLGGNVDLASALYLSREGEFDVVLDYLNGPLAESAMTMMAKNGRMIQIGSVAATKTTIDAQNARRRSLDVLGFAYYHAPIEEQRMAYTQACEAYAEGATSVPIRCVTFSSFPSAWRKRNGAGRERYVFKP